MIVSPGETLIEVHATGWISEKAQFQARQCWFCHLLQGILEKLNSCIRILSETAPKLAGVFGKSIIS